MLGRLESSGFEGLRVCEVGERGPEAVGGEKPTAPGLMTLLKTGW